MKIRLGKKLALAFGTIVTLMVVSSGLCHFKAEQISRGDTAAFSTCFPTVQYLVALQRDLNQTMSNGRQAILAGTEAPRREEARALFQAAWNEVDKDVVHLEEAAPRWSSEENRARFVQLKERLPQLRAAQEAAMDVGARGGPDAAVKGGNVFADRARVANEAIKKTLDEMAQSNQKLLEQKALEAEAANSSLRWTLWLTTLAAIAGLLVASILGRKISAAVASTLVRAEAIAQGDLTSSEVALAGRDETDDLNSAMNKMQSSLTKVVESILSSTEHLASASQQISAAAAQQSAGMETQKDQTRQVASAMQEMSSTIVQISENSNKAAESARKASETARVGGKVVEETLEKMREIASSVGDTAKKVAALGKSSDQIGQIIGVIDDIADQTNLLALNAAIEAARAGEQGRGFAVVADEVRKLAERTSKATKEIASMIQSIQSETKSAVDAMETGTKQVEAGVETTTLAGASLEEIISAAEQVGDMVAQIATAATQQSSATEEVNANIEQIAKITAETAEGAQQSAKACHDLSSLALDLQNVVSRFRLSGNGHGASGHFRSKVHARSTFRPSYSLRGGRDESREEEAVLTHSE
jgi:methyl-accepting chemotaxis protein